MTSDDFARLIAHPLHLRIIIWILICFPFALIHKVKFDDHDSIRLITGHSPFSILISTVIFNLESCFKFRPVCNYHMN